MSAPSQVTIVGASLAGLSILRELRDAGYDGPVTVVGDEPHLPYDRPPLSKAFLSADVDLALASPADISDLGARWLLGAPAIGIHTDAAGEHTVHLADGSTATAPVVVLATGARARTLPGCDGVPGVHVLRSIDDALALREALRDCRRLAVVGAGFIGAEVAATAQARGIDVTVVEATPTPLAGVLGEVLAETCAALHARNGVRLVTGAGVRQVTGTSPLTITLTDDTTLIADAVVVGIGAVPNTEWLQRPDILADNGFRTDPDGRTAVAGIYAVGDCASAFDPQLGTYHRSEHWTNATTAARRVTAAILGNQRPAAVAPYFWSAQYGHQLQYAGYRDPAATVRIVDGTPGEGPFVAVYENAGGPVAVFARDNPRLFTRYRKQIEGALRDAERAEAVTFAVHNTELETGRPSAALASDLDGYRDGVLSTADLLRHTVARYPRPT